MRQGDRQQLVGADRGVIAGRPVDHVQEAGPVVAHEAAQERAGRLGTQRRAGVTGWCPGKQPLRHRERLDPQRVDLDGLAGAWGDWPAVDACIHPGQRPALGALAQQTVAGSTPMPNRVPAMW